MKFAVLLFCFLLVAVPFSGYAKAQTEDIRQATGLPIPVGAQAIYGQVTVRGLKSDEKKPSVYVSLIVSGTFVDRTQTNDRGYYYFLRSPGDGATLLFELNNNEVGRVVLSASPGSSVRRDIDIDWLAAKKTAQTTGVVSMRAAYARSPEAEMVFDRAMVAVRSKKPNEALALFKQIVDKDPKDFGAWTEMGTMYFEMAKHAEAEAGYNKALAQKPDFMPALMNLGKLHLSQKQFEQAVGVFFKAVSTDSASAEGFHYLGESYLQARQGSKAVIALNEAIRLDPVGKANLHLRLATLYHNAGAKDRAANEYKLFLGKIPDYPKKSELEKYISENLK